MSSSCKVPGQLVETTKDCLFGATSAKPEKVHMQSCNADDDNYKCLY